MQILKDFSTIRRVPGRSYPLDVLKQMSFPFESRPMFRECEQITGKNVSQRINTTIKPIYGGLTRRLVIPEKIG